MPLNNILITGGTGLVGSRLTEMLEQDGYQVAHLSRNPSKSKHKAFGWDVAKGELDESALEWADAVIHLAGASIAGKRWSAERKKELRESRIKSLDMIREACNTLGKFPEVLVSGSAIGYYGYDSGAIWKKENSRFGDDFLATLTKDWEDAADAFGDQNTRIVKIRTGIVLSTKGGSLPLMVKPVKFGIGSPLGSGEQYVSWIHIDDICGIFKWALEDKAATGVYNGAAPEPVTNETLMRSIARTLGKPFFMPNVPAFVMKMVMGELASGVLGSSRVSSEKVIEEGYSFQYPEINSALKDLLSQALII